jgi:peptide-methionine (S)-S-oxide reductase
VVNRQFCDAGSPYRTAIFVHDEAQRRAAAASKAALERNKPFPQPIVTPIEAATTFYPAEEYHQDYHLKNPLRYRYYRSGCGRDARLKELWGAK